MDTEHLLKFRPWVGCGPEFDHEAQKDVSSLSVEPRPRCPPAFPRPGHLQFEAPAQRPEGDRAHTGGIDQGMTAAGERSSRDAPGEQQPRSERGRRRMQGYLPLEAVAQDDRPPAIRFPGEASYRRSTALKDDASQKLPKQDDRAKPC